MFILFLTIALNRTSDYRLIHFIQEAGEKYATELKLFKELQEKRKVGKIVFSAQKPNNSETYIVVIGESLNKNHMSLYGYNRQTTPKLSELKNELVIYDNAYSNHTHTVPVLSFALTQANQYNHKNYYDSLSIINILNRANIETYWLSNQNIYGAWDNMVSVIATDAKKMVALNHNIGCSVSSEHYDGDLISPLKTILEQKSNHNRVIFIHLLGSHSSYNERYPHDEFSIYHNDLKLTRNHRFIKNMKELNHYDNSVYYNDYVVSSILKLLQKQEGANAFLYLSDHSEDIDKDLGHSWERFTYEMTEIPFIGWFSQAYQSRYSKKYLAFKKHKKELFSNDMLYDTLIGLFTVKTKKYNAHYDLSSNKYELKEKDALVLHGKKSYVVPQNHRYWERKR